MASCDAGLIASIFCFICSFLTLSVGLIYIFLKIVNLTLLFDGCGLFEEDCNREWRTVFTLRPEVLLDLWTPTIFGLLGLSIHCTAFQPCPLVAKLLPMTYIQYAFLMTVTALFANFGYLGKAGIIVGILCLIAALFCIVVRLLGDVFIKFISLGWSSGSSSSTTPQVTQTTHRQPVTQEHTLPVTQKQAVVTQQHQTLPHLMPQNGRSVVLSSVVVKPVVVGAR